MIPFLHIVCYKWGTAYPAEEVNILRAMVRRNLNVPHRFYCVTDNGLGLDKDIVRVPLPAPGLPGNSPKLWTFANGFLGLDSDAFVVSLDIDLVIVDSIDFLAERPDESFIIAKHTSPKAKARGHGAVYRVRVGSHSGVWTEFIARPQAWAERHRGENGNAFSEQAWLERMFDGREIAHFPLEKIILYRRDCNSLALSHLLGRKAGEWGLTTAWFADASLPRRGEAIISFAGKINPRDVRERHRGHMRRAPFVSEHWRI
jgi:hypothetical protein